jgi:hypothetical protein
MQARHLDAQLTPVARPWQRDVTDVELDVDVGILDPVGPVVPERHGDRRRRNCGNCMMRDVKKRRMSLIDETAGGGDQIASAAPCSIVAPRSICRNPASSPESCFMYSRP